MLILGGVIKEMFSRYNTKMDALENEAGQLEEKKQLLDKWMAVNKQYQAREGEFFRGPDPLFYKRFVEEKIRDAGITLNYLSPVQKEEDFFWEVAMKLKVDAPYANLAAFLGELEEQNTIVEKISIKNSREGKETELSLRSYIIKE